MNELYVVIAGAGLGGLALGQSLKRAGIRFDIFENDQALDSRSQGYRIRIDNVGQNALAAILSPDLYQLFRQTASIASTSGCFLTPQLMPSSGRKPESWHSEPDSNQEEIAEADLSVNRRTLREILMCGIEEHVHFGQGIDQYNVQDDGQVLLHFNNNSPSIYCDILVGSDGVNSRVRSQLAPAAVPVDTGIICIYGKADIKQIEKDINSYKGTNIIFADGFTAILDEMRFSTIPAVGQGKITPVEDYLYWAIIGPQEKFGVTGTDISIPTKSVFQTITSLCTNWHPAIKTLLQQSDISNIAALRIRNGRPDVDWPTGSVTLLGDAIHSMSPAGGLGANTALKDALALTNAIKLANSNKGTVKQVLADYEMNMREWAQKAIQLSNDGAMKLSEPLNIR